VPISLWVWTDDLKPTFSLPMSLTDTEGRELLISLSGVYYSPLCSTERTSVASAVRSSLRFVIPHHRILRAPRSTIAEPNIPLVLLQGARATDPTLAVGLAS